MRFGGFGLVGLAVWMAEGIREGGLVRWRFAG